jgi:predicted restriction endonuclease
MAQASKKWTRDELLLALNLYHKLTFGQMHARNPAIIAVAEKLGRGPNSLAMKLCNFASLDPSLTIRGIKGLTGASALDRATWTEFHEHLTEAAPASEDAFQRLFDASTESEVEVTPREGIRQRSAPIGATERTANVKVRRGQAYFRDAVLNNFNGRCGVSGLAVRELLVASHILPWGKFETERLNVRNGLSLSRLHDAAFDVGLITFDSNLRLQLSRRLKSFLPERTVAEVFAAYAGQPLRLEKDAVLPEERFLAVHRADVFKR